MKTLILDNYDSFAYNLYQYVGELSAAPIVVRNDKVTLEDVRAMSADRILLSPGPGSPDNPAYFGICTEVIRTLGTTIPILGVCLGHQGIVHAFGGRVIRAAEVMHGKTSRIYHTGAPLFHGLPRAFEAMRYHSLIADPHTLPPCLTVTARTYDGVIMAVQHKELPIHGVQFHPESIGTDTGKRILANFLELAVPRHAAQLRASHSSPDRGDA